MFTEYNNIMFVFIDYETHYKQDIIQVGNSLSSLLFV